MLKEKKNRGAGLVTVVVVLAVASILLAGAVSISFFHYKKVLREETARQELAEIELCVEVLNVVLSKSGYSDALPLNSFSSSFYGTDLCFEQDGSYHFDEVVVRIETPDTVVSIETPDTVIQITCGETTRRYEVTNGKLEPEAEK